MSGSLSPTTPVNRRLAGITRCTVNGVVMPVTEFSWSPGNVKRESLTSLSGVDGYSEMPTPPYIALKFRDSQANSATAFNQLTSATVVVQLANGKTIVGHGLWNTGENVVAGQDATFDAKFEGVEGTVQELGVQ